MTEEEKTHTHIVYIKEALAEIKADIKEIKNNGKSYVTKGLFFWVISGLATIAGGVMFLLHTIKI